MPPIERYRRESHSNSIFSSIVEHLTEENRLYEFKDKQGVMSLYFCPQLHIYVVTTNTFKPTAADIRAIYEESYYREAIK